MIRAVPVLIMLPPRGITGAEHWMAMVRCCAAHDLVERLMGIDRACPVHVLAADPEDQAHLSRFSIIRCQAQGAEFHFGRELAAFVEQGRHDLVAYFGGASAPLVTRRQMEEALESVAAADSPLMIVNNYHSTDWAILNHAQALVPLADRLPHDNALGWVLHHDAGFKVDASQYSAASQADIDTPADLLLLEGHPNLGSGLREFLAGAPAQCLNRVRALREVLRTPAKTLAVIGRSSSHVWKELESRTEVWVRLFVEERGMVASGRATRGEVQSLVGMMLEAWGPQPFIAALASMADAVIWDTRVWMSHRGLWPSMADRFAADLGWVDEIQEPPLRALTQAIVEAPIPIITGGHGAVSGSLHAFLETLG